MLPTRPRVAARSISSSCTTPEPATATRVSCGVTLMRISSVTQLFKQFTCFVQGQAHDAGIAAAQLGDEARRAALDRVSPGLVVAFAARDVLPDRLFPERPEAHLGHREGALDPAGVFERYGAQYLVAAARQRSEHLGGFLAARGLAEDAAAERHGGVGGEHRRLRQVSLQHAAPAGFGLGARDALDVR